MIKAPANIIKEEKIKQAHQTVSYYILKDVLSKDKVKNS